MSQKAIRFEGIIGGVSTRVDGGLGIRMSTPELRPEEKTVFFGLQNILLEVAIFPKDSAESDLVTVKKPMDGKSPSQRLHAVLFLLWKQDGGEGQFDHYYQQKMESVINGFKVQLPEK